MKMAFLKCSEAQRVELEAGEWKERLYPGGRATCEDGGCSSPSNAPVSSSCPSTLLLCCHRFFFNNPSLKFEDFA